ncbi:unnamed protein product, partial [Urochloa humidicola]
RSSAAGRAGQDMRWAAAAGRGANLAVGRGGRRGRRRWKGLVWWWSAAEAEAAGRPPELGRRWAAGEKVEGVSVVVDGGRRRRRPEGRRSWAGG